MKIGIIGGGMMGLVLGYRISQKGHHVEILEATSQIGGLSTWFNYGDFIWDKYYHVILSSDRYLLNLIRELNLSEKLCWTATKTGFLWKGKHISMSNHLEFLKFPVLNFLQKIRLAIGILYCHYIENPSSLENITAKKWLIKIFGLKVYEVMWEPLLESKYGTLKEKVPAPIMWSTISRYYSTRKKRGGQEFLGHLKNEGLKILLDSLKEQIGENHGQIHCNTKIRSIDETSSKEIVVYSENSKTFTFDKLINTLPTTSLKKIAPHLQGIFTREFSPQFIGVIRLALILKRPLSPYYVTNLIDKGYPFTGIIEVSALTDENELGGHHLVMIPRYDLPNSEWFEKSEKEIKNIFFQDLKKTWPDIEDNCINFYVHRERIVQALWIDAPSFRIQSPQSTMDGRILSINNELAGRSTLNNNVLVEIANRYAKELF